MTTSFLQKKKKFQLMETLTKMLHNEHEEEGVS